MRKLLEVLDYLRGLGYRHHQLAAFVNDTDGVQIGGVSYIISYNPSGENLALPHEDYMKLVANVPMYLIEVEEHN
jgi:hypothetical protein|tara:strand:+ start:1005 stop:1229 length:225 start_codon:yes stop_codon:yes gene_type:complete